VENPRRNNWASRAKPFPSLAKQQQPKQKAGDKSDMLTLPPYLGCGKTRTAALGAITSSSYYQATPCPSTKIDQFDILMTVSEGLEKGLIISCRFYPTARASLLDTAAGGRFRPYDHVDRLIGLLKQTLMACTFYFRKGRFWPLLELHLSSLSLLTPSSLSLHSL
jgi:hypothetical protein